MALIDLVRQPATTLEQVKTEIASLEAANTLQATLANGAVLNAAIEFSTPEIVLLLLENDSPIAADYQTSLTRRTQPNKERVTGILHFYNAVKERTRLLPNFRLGKTLSLIKESLDHLQPFHGQEIATLLIGHTTVGKSTLSNVFFGVEYETRRQGMVTFLAARAGSPPERTRINPNVARSETTYPQILRFDGRELNGQSLVDMPGFRDTRGLAYQICTGVSTNALANCFNQVKTIVALCTEADLRDPAGANFRDTVTMLGNIIQERAPLRQNLLLIVNKVVDQTLEPSHVVEQLQHIATTGNLPAPVNFVLRAFTTEKIILVKGVPGRPLKEEFFRKITPIAPQPFAQFNFAGYHTEAEQFRNLITILREYQTNTQNAVNGLQTFLAQQKRTALNSAKQALIQDPFAPVPAAPAILPECRAEVDNLNRTLTQQQGLKADLLALAGRVEGALNSFIRPELIEPYVGDPLVALRERKARKAIVDELMNKMQPVLTRMGM